jgi:hypothetical protein
VAPVAPVGPGEPVEPVAPVGPSLLLDVITVPSIKIIPPVSIRSFPLKSISLADTILEFSCPNTFVIDSLLLLEKRLLVILLVAA